MATKAQIKFTYEDYKSLPYSERERFELLEGELIPAPSPETIHQRILRRLGFRLVAFVEEQHAGEVFYAPYDVVLSGEEVVQPDLLYVSPERQRFITRENLQGAPDLAVEILSPTTAQKDRAYKRKLYAKYGVQEYWIVAPEEETIEVLMLGRRGYERAGLYKKHEQLTSPLLIGLQIPLDAIF